MSTLLRSSFSIDRERVGAAYEYLMEWAKLTSAPVPNNILKAKTLMEAVAWLGFDLLEDQQGNITGIVQTDNDVDGGWQEQAMESFARYVDESFMLFHSDDDKIYQWTWVGGEFEVWIDGIVVFAHQLRSLKSRIELVLESEILKGA